MSFALYTNKTVDASLHELNSSSSGLSVEEAARRLQTDGPNELATHSVLWYKILFRQFTSPFLYLLAGAAGIAFVLGEMIDGSMITAFVLINAGLGFAQEYHSERAVELLRTFVKKRSRVRRDGKEILVDSRELVTGDIVIVETGDVMQADVRFLEMDRFVVDESALTGESVAVSKSSEPLVSETHEAYQAKNIGFAGTTVVSGRAIAVVFATGIKTQIGEVSSLTTETQDKSAFEKSLGTFSVLILRVIVVTIVLVFVANILIKGGDVDLPELLIFSIALAVSVIPEALPVVMTMTLSRGAIRLAREQVVVKRLSAIEDLGSIDVLCTDKTGTLTENKMAVAHVFADDQSRCLFLAAAASSFLGEKEADPNNAFDIAIWNRLDVSVQNRVRQSVRTDEVPFDPSKRWNSVVVDGQLVVRGAPEEIMFLCHISGSQPLEEWIQQEGKKGRRVLAIATGTDDTHLALAGVISFEDPVKATAVAAIAHAKQLGVQMKILTGDRPEVAGSVAMTVGLISDVSHVITGEAWEKLSQEDRIKSAKSHAVFARVSPQQKYLIIQALRTEQEVGFLGEGINDAPALKMASVGIVVDGASDIAREAADIVLLKHSLEVIVGGIREGREVFANTVKYIKATLASNFGNFLAVATATLLVDYLPMLPVQILLVNLLSDFPMIAIATDAVDPEELKRPRSYDLKDIVYSATVLGIVSTVFDFIFFFLFSRISPEVLQTNWFIGSILTELVLIFSIRSRGAFWRAVRPSATLFWLSLVAMIVTVAIPFTEMGERIFHFIIPSSKHLLLIACLVVVYFVVTETVKRLYYRKVDRQSISKPQSISQSQSISQPL